MPRGKHLHAPPCKVPTKVGGESSITFTAFYQPSLRISAVLPVPAIQLCSAIDVLSSSTPPDDGSSMSTPPSPTPPNTSSFVHFQPSPALWNNKPRNATPIPKSTPLEQVSSQQTTHQDELAQDRDMDPAPFIFKPYELAHMVDPKNIDTLTRCGGTAGFLNGLGTSREIGLSAQAFRVNANTSHQIPIPSIVPSTPDTLTSPSPDTPDIPVFSATLDLRRRVYGSNILPTRTSKSLPQLMWMALKDKVLVLLSIAAVISLALGLFQDFGTEHPPEEAPVDWVEGVAIMVAVAIVVIVGSLNNWQKERQFMALNDKKQERGIKVIRNGQEKLLDIKELVVGDIVLVEPGEIVPCDGVFLSGHNVVCDESGATGESDPIKKVSFEEWPRTADDGGPAHTDCFMVSGSKVLEGVGRYVVIAVGTKSFNGRIIMDLRENTDNIPLQVKLNHLAELIAKIGSLAGLLLFCALMIRFFVQLGTGEPNRAPIEKGMSFINILIIAVTLIVVAVPEGLPLSITLALAFATKRMTYEKLLVRVLGSCETMGNASVICADKTGTLTQNVMTVVAGSVGINAKFVRQLEDNSERTNASASASAFLGPSRHNDNFSIDQGEFNTILSPALQTLFNEAIAVNSTVFEDVDSETQQDIFVGSKTEVALLKFAKELGWEDFKQTRDTTEVIQIMPFSSEKKAMGVVVKKKDGKGYRCYFKGASEILSKKCRTHIVVKAPNGGNAGFAGGDGIETKEIDAFAEDNLSQTIIFYSNQGLRTITLCYRDFESWPPYHNDHDEVPYEVLAHDLTLIGIIGIENPLREGVREAVAKCLKAGVTVKMCTGENVLTARSIAIQCGIFTSGGIIMEGPVFRNLTHSERVEIVPRLQVLARSSPEDKRVLVETLKSIGEIVSVTGGGTSDGPTLKTADIGFSMGIAGTEVAREASDIVLMDDNFSSIVKAIMWGRCVNDAVRKFLQFQISTNIAAVVVTFLTAIASAEQAPVLSAVQLLWIHIVMDPFAALALTTDPATEALLDRKPHKRTAPLFSTNMYKQIAFQSIYQIIICLIFHFLGLTILGLEDTKHNDAVVQTLVFNTFVFAQIFNSFNCRRLDKKLNIFEGITKNVHFIVITLLEISIQVLFISVDNRAFRVTPLTGREWGLSLALGIAPVPLGVLVRLTPNGPFDKLFTRIGLLDQKDVLPTANLETEVHGRHLKLSSFITAQDLRNYISRFWQACVLFVLPSFHALSACPLDSLLSPRLITSGGPLASPLSPDSLATIERLWVAYLNTRISDWKVIFTLACVLLGLSLTIFQIPQAANDPFTYVFAALVQCRALAGLLYAAVLCIYFENDYTRTGRFAMVWWKCAVESKDKFWNTWIMLSLPAASTLWALLFYFLAIINFTFRPISDNHPTPLAFRIILQLTIASTTLSDAICFTCIWITLKKYREAYYDTPGAGY